MGNETVLNTAADPANIQVLYLWEKGNIPAKTKFTQKPFTAAVEGFSPRNLRRMRAFYAAYEESPEIMRGRR